MEDLPEIRGGPPSFLEINLTWNMVPLSEWIETEEHMEEAVGYLRSNMPEDGFAFDTETTGLNITSDLPILISFSDGKRRFACEAEWARYPALLSLFEDKTIPKIATNIKYDCHIMANFGILVAGELRDTLSMDWLFDENRVGMHGLKETASAYCGLKMKNFKEVFPMRKKTIKHPADTPGDAIRRAMADPVARLNAIEYAGLDALASFWVYEYLKPRLANIPIQDGYSLWNYFLSIEVPFLRTLWNCERRGITISTGNLKAQKAPMEKDMIAIEAQFAKEAGETVNLRSPQQLGRFFYDLQGKEPFKYTKGGKSGNKKPSTDVEVLDVWAGQGDTFATLVLKHRDISKTYSTYIKGLLSKVDSDLKVHTTLNSSKVVTGRLSSTDPNLQNIKRTAKDKWRLRYAFVADPDHVLIVADYEQLEMRIMAHCSEDKNMLSAIRNNIDLHCYTVTKMFDMEYDEVIAAKKADNPTEEQKRIKELRQAAKSIGFGLIYGMGPKHLAHDLTKEFGRLVTIKEAKNLIELYFQTFEGARSYITNTKRDCKFSSLEVVDSSIQNSGSGVPYVTTITGRFRRLPQINARSKFDSSQAERQSVNSIIQGTAADIAKFAMIGVDNNKELADMGVILLLQVHDELIFQCPEDQNTIDRAQTIIKEIMENPFPDFSLSVPIPTTCDYAYTWGDAK